jgi:hypothetical protein
LGRSLFVRLEMGEQFFAGELQDHAGAIDGGTLH